MKPVKHGVLSWLAVSVLAIASYPAGLLAQTPNQNFDNTGYGTTSAEFLLFGAGARGTALGNSYAALASDVSALYYNPAGAALVSRPGLTIGTYDYVDGTRYSWGGLVFPFSGGSRAVGIQAGTFGFKDQPVYTSDQPNGDGSTYSVSETFVGLTFAQNFSDRFSAGFTAKGVFDELGTVSGQAFAVDFGTNFHASLAGHPVRLGFVLTNLGTTLKYEGSALNRGIDRDSTGGGPASEPVPTELKTKGFSLPTTFNLGLAYDIMSAGNNRFTALASFNQPNNNKAGFGVGGEFQADHLGGSPFGGAIRGSYNYAAANNIDVQGQTALNDEENLQGLAFGGGLNYLSGNFSLGVDYAFKYMGVLGGTNFVSFTLGW
jgi:hypothetical protein